MYVCRQVKSPRRVDLSSRGVISSVYASLGVIRCNNPLHFQWVKVKWSRYRPDVAQRVGRGIALLFHDRGNRRGWVVSSTLRPHFTPAKDPVPVLQETGWALGPVRAGGKSRPHRGSIPDRPARSQSLYRLSYPAHHFQWVGRRIQNKKRERKKERRKERKKENGTATGFSSSRTRAIAFSVMSVFWRRYIIQDQFLHRNKCKVGGCVLDAHESKPFSIFLLLDVLFKHSMAKQQVVI